MQKHELYLVKNVHPILAGDQTLPTTGKASADDWTKGESSQDTTAEHMQPTLKILSESPGPDEQGTLYCRVIQDLFSIKPLEQET